LMVTKASRGRLRIHKRRNGAERVLGAAMSEQKGASEASTERFVSYINGRYVAVTWLQTSVRSHLAQTVAISEGVRLAWTIGVEEYPCVGGFWAL